MSRKLLMPSLVFSKSDLTKCVKCGLNIPKGEMVIKVPSLTQVGADVHFGSANTHTDCFDKEWQGICEKAVKTYQEKAAREMADSMVTSNPDVEINLAEPKRRS